MNNNRRSATKIYRQFIEKKIGNIGRFDKQKIREAWITNLARDISELKVGFLATSLCDIDLQLRTALEAIQAYIVQPDDVTLYEAIAMIQLVEWILREAPESLKAMNELEAMIREAASARDADHSKDNAQGAKEE